MRFLILFYGLGMFSGTDLSNKLPYNMLKQQMGSKLGLVLVFEQINCNTIYNGRPKLHHYSSIFIIKRYFTYDIILM